MTQATTELKTRLDQLTREQRALLAKHLQLNTTGERGIPRNAATTPVPLSFSQERLWLMEQLFPDLPVHNIYGVTTHYGELDTHRLRQCFELVFQRHEALRTAIVMEDSVPAQRVCDGVKPEWMEFDVSGLEPGRRRAESDALISNHALRNFDLAQGVLLRVVVIKLSHREHRVMVCMDHIAADGWSTSILIREVLDVYEQLSLGIAPRLAELPIQYSDFTLWQRKRLDEESLNKQLAFWESYLEGAPPRLNLPVDKPRPSSPSYSGERVNLEFPQELSAALNALAARAGVTPFMLLLGGYAALLSRYSGQDDLVVGVPVMGREHKDLEGLIGCFINPMGIRIGAVPRQTFAEMLAAVRTSVLAAYEHSETPFEMVVNRMQPTRDSSFSPIFQASFSFEREPMNHIAAGAGAAIAFEELNLGVARYDLSLEITTGSNGFSGWLDFSTDLFERPTIERMAQQFLMLLRGAVANPETAIGALDILPARERKAVLDDLNQTDTEYSREASVPGLFAGEVAAHPESIAVVDGERQLSYAQLDLLSTRLCARLQAAGIGRESVVVLGLERSLEAIVSILAVLKAGAAYLPIDLNQPSSRTESQIATAQAGAVLTDRAHREHFPADATVLWADLQALENCGEEAVDLPPVAATDAAYIMYTSGSTGTPKGVVVTHRNILRLVRGANYAEMGPDEVGLQLASLSFDASTYEIWAPLLNGGKLAIAPAGLVDFGILGELIHKHGVTSIFLTTRLFQGMLDENPEGLRPLRQLITGGETISMPHVRKFVAAIPHCRLIHAYGPTETTTFACCHTITAEDLGKATAPIGGPLANTTAYVLDSLMNPVPIGIPGELYLGGDGVGKGYINAPEVTAEKFLDDPFRAVPGAKMYRTGDHVRLLANGLLVFVGRNDDLVKIRGFRIELGEIESALLRHASVSQAAVLVRPTGENGEKHLVAYVVLKAGANCDAATLTAYLKDIVPSYMVPACTMILDKFPMSVTGKIDRKLLPEPVMQATEQNDALGSDVELKLALVWKDLLKVEKIGRNDNFFDLFGDSIKALQMVSRASKLGLRFTPYDVFTRQSLAELAEVAEPINAENAAIEERPDGDVPLTPIQRWFFSLDIENPSHWNQWMFFKLDQKAPSDVIATAIGLVAERHDALRLRFRKTETGWEQYLESYGDIGFEYLDLSCLPIAERRAAFTEAANRLHESIHIENGPLCSVMQVEGLEETTQLMVVAHHLICDQVTWHVLVEDLFVAYQAVAAGTPPRFQAKSQSFAHWSRSLAGTAQESELQSWIAYWNGLGLPAAAQLPVDMTGEANRECTAQEFAWTLSQEATAELRESQRAYMTRLNDFLLMALADTLNEWNGNAPVQIDVESAGRGAEQDLARTMGWFTRIYPVALESPQQDLASFIQSSSDRLIEATRLAPTYGALRYGADGVDRLPGIARSQVSFNFLGEIQDEVANNAEFGLSCNDPFVARSPESFRTHLLAVDAMILRNRLKVHWTYSAKAHRPETIERLAERFGEKLQRLVAFCKAKGKTAFAPESFPLARLGSSGLDKLVAAIQKRSSSTREEAISAIEDVYVQSPLQEGLIFHALMHPHSDDYLVQFVMSLEGPLHTDLLHRAWLQVVARHPALRTSFHFFGLAHPVQVVERIADIPWETVDLGEGPAAAKEAALQQLLKEDRTVPFDLGSAPLMRVRVVKVNENSHRLIWTYHHLILDGWSMGVALREIFSLYGHMTQDKELQFAPAPAYRSYIANRVGQDREKALAFWRGYLEGFHAPTPLPKDAGADSAAPVRASVDRWLAAGDASRLSRGLQSKRLTLATVLHGVWALLLGMESGEQDVVFGSTVSGRNLDIEGIENMVGLLINTLPQRVKINGATTVAEWLAELQESMMSTWEHDSCGMVDIQRVSQIKPGTALLESAIVVENYPIESDASNGPLRIVSAESIESAGYPLYLIAIPGAQIRLRFFYDATCIGKSTVDRLSNTASALLGLLSDSWQMDVASWLEKARMASRPAMNPVAGGEQDNGTVPSGGPSATLDGVDAHDAVAQPVPPECCIQELFEAQAKKTPHALAVMQGEEAITYAELDQKASRMARRLREDGVGPDQLVGICLERGIEMITAILAVWKAGGAYLPLDPSYPLDRLQYMVEDSSPAVLVTWGEMADRFRNCGVETPVFDIRLRASEGATEASTPLDPSSLGLKPHNLAYVIYTSGSTGRPKGVMNEHRGLCNLALAQAQLLGVTAESRVLQFSSFSFDASVFELTMALTAGATLCLPPKGPIVLGEALLDLMAKDRPTHAVLPPAVLSSLPVDSRSNSIQTLLVAGDALPGALMQRWARGRRLINAYGPTETTVCATMHECDANDSGAPPIGQPILNTRIHLLDSSGEPVEAGSVGEIYISGTCVARGYLNQPELTAGRFSLDPLAREPQTRMYKSGDMGRLREDGALEFLGRSDLQVKVRGYRVELPEIEARLSQCPGVREAAVAAPRDKYGDRYLVAYYTGCDQGQPGSPEQLRERLGRELPEYMVPATYVRLDAFPLTANGKVDRKALPLPHEIKPAAQNKPDLAAGDHATQLARIWRELLEIDAVGYEDHFYQLGGHSLLLVRLQSRILEQMGVLVSIPDLLQYPTIEALAGYLQDANADRDVMAAGRQRAQERNLQARYKNARPQA